MSRRTLRVALFALACTVPAPITQVRGQDVWTLMNDADAKVTAALDERTTLDVENQPLTTFVESLRERHGINVQLDYKALSDAGTDIDVPISVHARDASLRSALRLALSKLQLSLCVRDGYLLITSGNFEEDSLEMRIYRVRDLISLDSGLTSRVAFAGTGADDFRELLQVITATVEPTTWDDVGGPAAIKANPDSQTLWIFQTPEAHELVAQLLDTLRGMRDKQAAAAKAVAEAPRDPGPPAMSVKVYRLVGSRPVPSRAGDSGAAPDLGRPSFDGFPNKSDKGDNGSTTDSSKMRAPSEAKDTQVNSVPIKADSSPSAVEAKELGIRAKEIAALLPDVLAPESWQPTGKGVARAAAGAIVVRQTEEVHQQIGRLLGEILQEQLAPLAPINEPTVRLAVCGPQKDWPSAGETVGAAVSPAVEKALDQKVMLQLRETPLREFLETVRRDYGLAVDIEPQALRDANVTADAPITRDLRGLTLRAAMRLVLSDLDLAYAVRGEAITITSPLCDPTLDCKIYPVFDLVVRSPEAPPVSPAVDFKPLIDGLTSTVAPVTWDDVGGPGSAMSFASSGALVVLQTAAVHEEIDLYLRTLREIGATR
jgi:hypothetical protein